MIAGVEKVDLAMIGETARDAAPISARTEQPVRDDQRRSRSDKLGGEGDGLRHSAFTMAIILDHNNRTME